MAIIIIENIRLMIYKMAVDKKVVLPEPIHFPTNEENGYGYFNAYYPNSKIFHLGQY